MSTTTGLLWGILITLIVQNCLLAAYIGSRWGK